MFAKIFHALLPVRCLLCSASARRGFCAACSELLPWNIIACERCGTNIPEVGICGACLACSPHYDIAIIPFNYLSPIAPYIKMLKYHNQLKIANALGAMIARRVWQHNATPPDIIVPIPLHKRRLRTRGFNQAAEIAAAIGRDLGIKVSHNILTRIKNTRPQVGLTTRQRLKNVRGAFVANPKNQYQHIALVDDVVTSGGTVNAAARTLKKAGVQQISVWAAAKT